jgi:hypothetical protein
VNELELIRRAKTADVDLAIDAHALYADIVARPGDPVAARRRRRLRSKRTIVVIAVALGVVVTAGTAFGFGVLGWHTDNSIVSNPREWRALYRAATRELTLPPGVKWPYRTLAANSVTSRDYPGGMAVGISQISWECYWVSAIRTHDIAGEHHAQAALADIVQHHIVVAPPGSPENVAPPASVKPPFEIYASDGGLQFDKHMYAQAAAGNPAGIAQSCRANGPIS